MAFSVFCGNKIEDDQLFCGYCGADLSMLRKKIEEESRNDSTSAVKSAGKREKSSTYNKGFLVSLIISIVILLAALGFLAFYLKKRDFNLVFDDKIFSQTSIDGMNAYAMSKDVSVIEGTFSGSKPEKLTYRIYGGENYIIKEGELETDKTWKIEDGGLSVGQNLMVVEADYLIGNPKIKTYVILKYEQKNGDRIGLD